MAISTSVEPDAHEDYQTSAAIPCWHISCGTRGMNPVPAFESSPSSAPPVSSRWLQNRGRVRETAISADRRHRRRYRTPGCPRGTLWTRAGKRRQCSDTITAVVTVTDDGGSSGRLRRDFGVLPPGDIRNCLAALASTDSPFRQLLQHQFDTVDGLEGHPVGNLLLTALTQITGDFAEAVSRLSEMVGLRGRVLPTTSEDVRLRAEMESGQVLTGETAIVARRLEDSTTVARTQPTPASRSASSARQCGRNRRRSWQPVHQHPSQLAGGGHRVDDLWRQRRPDLRRQPDDRAGRNRSTTRSTITCARSDSTPVSICSTTSW